MDKKRKIFDDDATVVEVVEVDKRNEPTVPIVRRAAMKSESKTVKVTDVLDTFAGYLPSQAAFTERTNRTEGTNRGECVLCGKETTNELRKVCFDCLKTHSMELHHEAVDTMLNGKTEFEMIV